MLSNFLLRKHACINGPYCMSIVFGIWIYMLSRCSWSTSLLCTSKDDPLFRDRVEIHGRMDGWLQCFNISPSRIPVLMRFYPTKTTVRPGCASAEITNSTTATLSSVFRSRRIRNDRILKCRYHLCISQLTIVSHEFVILPLFRRVIMAWFGSEVATFSTR